MRYWVPLFVGASLFGCTGGFWVVSRMLDLQPEQSSGVQMAWWSGVFLELGGGCFLSGCVAVLRQIGGYGIFRDSSKGVEVAGQNGDSQAPLTWEEHGRRDVELAALWDQPSTASN